MKKKNDEVAKKAKKNEEKTTTETTQAATPDADKKATAETAESELDALKNQAADYLDKWQRLGAEFDNFRKRTATEKASMYDNGVKDTFLSILPVLDNFERAMSAINADDYAEDALYKGLTQILKQFTSILEANGITEIDALGKPFDLNLHNAVAQDASGEFEANTVSGVLMKGYLHKDKVIRHSMVKVAE